MGMKQIPLKLLQIIPNKNDSPYVSFTLRRSSNVQSSCVKSNHLIRRMEDLTFESTEFDEFDLGRLKH